MNEKLNKALEIEVDGLPTDEQLTKASDEWKKSS
jgi:hypothetical protein